MGRNGLASMPYKRSFAEQDETELVRILISLLLGVPIAARPETRCFRTPSRTGRRRAIAESATGDIGLSDTGRESDALSMNEAEGASQTTEFPISSEVQYLQSALPTDGVQVGMIQRVWFGEVLRVSQRQRCFLFPVQVQSVYATGSRVDTNLMARQVFMPLPPVSSRFQHSPSVDLCEIAYDDEYGLSYKQVREVGIARLLSAQTTLFRHFICPLLEVRLDMPSYFAHQKNRYLVLQPKQQRLVDKANGNAKLTLFYADCRYDWARRSFDAEQIRFFAFDLMLALAFCHIQGFMHRDVRPQNIVVMQTGEHKSCSCPITDTFALINFSLGREAPLQIYEPLVDAGEAEQCYSNSDRAAFESLTPVVATLWYRAPELLLGSRRYSAAADLWAAACVIAEVANVHGADHEERALFRGKSEVEQLHLIAGLVGGPLSDHWHSQPQASRLPYFGCGHQVPSAEAALCADTPQRARFEHCFGPDGFDFMWRLLQPNPTKRMKALEALDHPYLLAVSRRIGDQCCRGRALAYLRRHQFTIRELHERCNETKENQSSRDSPPANNSKPKHESLPWQYWERAVTLAAQAREPQTEKLIPNGPFSSVGNKHPLANKAELQRLSMSRSVPTVADQLRCKCMISAFVHEHEISPRTLHLAWYYFEIICYSTTDRFTRFPLPRGSRAQRAEWFAVAATMLAIKYIEVTNPGTEELARFFALSCSWRDLFYVELWCAETLGFAFALLTEWDGFALAMGAARIHDSPDCHARNSRFGAYLLELCSLHRTAQDTKPLEVSTETRLRLGAVIAQSLRQIPSGIQEGLSTDKLSSTDVPFIVQALQALCWAENDPTVMQTIQHLYPDMRPDDCIELLNALVMSLQSGETHFRAGSCRSLSPLTPAERWNVAIESCSPQPKRQRTRVDSCEQVACRLSVEAMPSSIHQLSLKPQSFGGIAQRASLPAIQARSIDNVERTLVLGETESARDLLRHLFAGLSLAERMRMRRVCRTWRDIIENTPAFWYELDLTECPDTLTDAALMNLLHIVERLMSRLGLQHGLVHKLDLTGCWRLSARGLHRALCSPALAHLRVLRLAELSPEALTDELVFGLKPSTLEEVDLRARPGSGLLNDPRALMHLLQLPLRVLNISEHPGITLSAKTLLAAASSSTAALPRLEVFIAHGCGFTVDVSELTSLPTLQLRHLDWSFLSFTGGENALPRHETRTTPVSILLHMLQHAPYLETLRLAHWPMLTDDDVRKLCQTLPAAAQIRELNLMMAWELTDASAEVIAKYLSALHTLDLSSTAVRRPFLSLFPEETRYVLQQGQICARSELPLTNLRVLALNFTAVSERDLYRLAPLLASLERLFLVGTFPTRPLSPISANDTHSTLTESVRATSAAEAEAFLSGLVAHFRQRWRAASSSSTSLLSPSPLTAIFSTDVYVIE